MFGTDVGSKCLLIITFADSRNFPVIDAVKSAGIEFCANFKFNNSAIFSEDNYNI